MKSECIELLKIMESLLAGEINCECARINVEALSMKEFPNLYSNLHHYYDDEDIRYKDPEYKKFQDCELGKLIYHLKAGDIEKANEISFLHES
jgi:hypothetical protein